MDIKDKSKEKHLNELMVGVRERIGKHRDSLAELADEVIQLQVEEMSAKAKVLAQIAGGAEKGALMARRFRREENHHTGALPGDTGQNQGATGRQCQGCNAEGS